MKQLLFVSFTFLFLVCFSDSSASLYLFHLFWRANQLNSKTCRRDDTIVGDKRYLMSISQWFGLPLYCLKRPDERQSRQPTVREGRCSRCSGALLLFHTVFLGTNEYLF